MQTTIPWKEWGYELVACAENGAQAWEKIKRYRPDIVILDIHMPGMSGLDLASELQKLPEKPLIILLSAYDRFAYAKTGLRLGVFDYLLKPLDNDELKLVLDKASRELQKTSQESERLWRRAWCEKLLMESTGGSAASAVMLEGYLKERWHPYGYALLLARKQNECELEFEDFWPAMGELLKRERIGCLNAQTRDGSLILLGFQTLRLVRDYDMEALHVANEIVRGGQRAGLQLSIGISNYAERLSDPQKQYDEAKFALESRFFLENKSVIHYQSVMSKSVRNEYLLSRKLQELYRAANRSPEEFTECLDAFIDLLEQDDRYDAEYVRAIFAQIAFQISCVLDRCSPGDRQIKTMATIQEEVQRIGRLQDLIAWIRAYAGSCRERTKQETAPASAQTRRVLDYLNTHFMEHVTLKDAAQEAGISEGHLCRLLKNETGETFVNILNKIRIQNALQLLKSGSYKVYEVADRVGFNNYAYFYQVFKKITGTSPTDYHQPQ